MRYFLYYNTNGSIIGWFAKDSKPIQEGYVEVDKTRYINELSKLGVTYPTPPTEEEKKAIRDERVRLKMAEFYPVFTDELAILFRGTDEATALHESRYLSACKEADEYMITL